MPHHKKGAIDSDAGVQGLPC